MADQSFCAGPRVFERARNTFRFVLLGALLSTTVSALIGVTSLTLGGYAPRGQYLDIWVTWWLGDATGILSVTPLLVIWLTQPYPDLKPGRILEAFALLVALSTIGYFVFLVETGPGLEYLVILPLLWASFRFGQRGAVTAAFFVSGIALLGTLRGMSSPTNESLLYLQRLTGSISAAALVLASVISERMRVEQRLEVQEAVSRILADSTDLKEAGPRILQVLCVRAKWTTGAIWNVDRAANKLVCAEFWHLPAADVRQFEAVSRQRTFEHGVGLPGRVWSSGQVAWIADVTKDDNFPRAPIAVREGLRAGFGFPIKMANDVVGIIECFSREVREPDDDFLLMMADIGGQVGRFIERKRSENDIAVLNQRLRAVCGS